MPRPLKHKISVQRAFKSPGQPERRDILHWAEAVFDEFGSPAACVVRIVGEAESARLNQQFRNKNGPTNVLSFPFGWPEALYTETEDTPRLLGDLVVCAPVVASESEEQDKVLKHHWAHMIVHGALHLMGYDHIEDSDAQVMEAMEIAILAKFDIKNPYFEVSE